MELTAISVIIPMYNAEKYIGDCLESLLAQTFQNFEVIVVDDYSTDKSVAIVKNFTEKFDGKLTFTSLQKKSDNFGYTARNRGFDFSRGEYVFFMDADDMISDTALEELYTAAKNFNADVVYTGARYLYTSKDDKKIKFDREGRNFKRRGIAEEPTLTTSDPDKLLKSLLIRGGLFWTTWTKLVKRSFLLEQGISFYEIISGGDFIWTIELFCCAERFLRIPNAVYFWRGDSITSVTRTNRPVEIQISTWDKVFFHIARAMADLASKREILRKNPAYCYFALKLHLEYCLRRTDSARSQFKPEEVYEILSREIEDKDGFDMLIKFFFSYMEQQQKEIYRLKSRNSV